MKKTALGLSIVTALFLFSGCGGGGGGDVISEGNETVALVTEFTDSYARKDFLLKKAYSPEVKEEYKFKAASVNLCPSTFTPFTETLEKNVTSKVATVKVDFDKTCYTDEMYVSYDYLANGILESTKNVTVLNPQYDQSNVYKEEDSDPLLKYQWYLSSDSVKPLNTAELNFNVNINAKNAWNLGVSGKNVAITLIGGRVDLLHRDLNSDFSRSYDYQRDLNNTTPYALNGDESTDTLIAGVISAKGKNSIGIRGVAFESSLANVVPFDKDSTLDALNRDLNKTDIYLLKSSLIKDLDFDLFKNKIAYAEANGRDGKGVVFVTSAADEAKNTAYNKIFTQKDLIVVSSVSPKAKRADYTGYGTNVLISAPTGEKIENVNQTDRLGILSTDPSGDKRGFDLKTAYTTPYTHFDVKGNENYDYSLRGYGSDFSSALVTGVIALMLEKNPNLTYRDVAVILARSANPSEALEGGFTVNKAGHKYSRDYGFGIVDAQKAVALASLFESLKPQISVEESNTTDVISDNGEAEKDINIADTDNYEIEKVYVSVNVETNQSKTYVTDTYSDSGKGSKSNSYKLNENVNQIALNFDGNEGSSVEVTITDGDSNEIAHLSFDSNATESFDVNYTGTYTVDLSTDSNTTWDYTITSPRKTAKADELNITVTSPGGTAMTLINDKDGYYKTDGLNETFLVNGFLDENSSGKWKINVKGDGEFKLKDVKIKILGHSE